MQPEFHRQDVLTVWDIGWRAPKDWVPPCFWRRVVKLRAIIVSFHCAIACLLLWGIAAHSRPLPVRDGLIVLLVLGSAAGVCWAPWLLKRRLDRKVRDLDRLVCWQCGDALEEPSVYDRCSTCGHMFDFEYLKSRWQRWLSARIDYTRGEWPE